MIKLLSSLKKLPAENCVILTYNLELPFFEFALFEPLYGYGCRNTIIISDPQQYQISLEDAPLLRYAGQRYLLFSGQTSKYGAFHPKLIFLTNNQGGYLSLTSGNLSRAGYTTNWEVVTEFVFDSRHPDPVSWRMFRWAYSTIGKIIRQSDPSGLGEERLDRLWGTTAWLRDEFPQAEQESIWVLDNLEIPLLDQIEEIFKRIDGHPIEKAIIVSPFFDSQSQAFNALLSGLQPKTIQVYTQFIENLNAKTLRNVLRKHSVELLINKLSISRRLHAKALLLQTRDSAWLATGSANFTSPALLSIAQQGNTEMLALRREADSTHFESWLDELVTGSVTLDINQITPPLSVTREVIAPPQLNLEAANLRSLQLELLITPLPAIGETLSVTLESDTSFTNDYLVRKYSPPGWVTITLPKEIARKLDSPTKVYISKTETDGVTLRSTSALLHNITALARFSKLPRNDKRPPIPEGLVTEDEEECVHLLEMIHELLITNRDQLKRHNPHIVSQQEKEKQEEQITEEYNPDDHIVAEPIRHPIRSGASGDELYPDYEERLTYQEILNAVLAAAYHPGTPPITELPKKDTEETPGNVDQKKKRPKQTREEKERLKARISNGFNRLVENVLEGISDQEYISSISHQYLLELWTIITAYLRVVWRSYMLDSDTFCDLSLSMFYGFWGKPAEPGVWPSLRERFQIMELESELKRLSIPLNSWLHSAVLLDLFYKNEDARRFDLAGWMRLFAKNVFPMEALGETDENTYSTAWYACFPRNYKFFPVDQLIKRLYQASLLYDDQSLADEIQERSGFIPVIEYGNIANVIQVPKLIIKMPLSESSLNSCFDIFRLFLNTPSLKSYAWARFENINPVIGPDDIRTVTVFFRSNEKSLCFAAERLKDRDYRPDYDLSGITIDMLNRIHTVGELDGFQRSDY